MCAHRNQVDPRLHLASIRRPPSADEEDSVKYLQILIFPVGSCSGFSPGSWIHTGEERGADQPSISWVSSLDFFSRPPSSPPPPPMS